MGFLATIVNYLFYSSFVLLPVNQTVCKSVEPCPIEWDAPMHGHIELQMEKNETWSSTTDSGKSFLSVIVDQTTTNYDWVVPHYLTQFWEHPKRVILTNLDTSASYYSDEFTITGVTVGSNLSTVLNSDSNVLISWMGNANSNTFGVYLTQDGNIFETIEPAVLPVNYTYDWKVPYLPSKEFNIMIRSNDTYTYAMTQSFQIATTTTTTTTTISSSTISTSPEKNVTRSPSMKWYYILLIALGLIFIVCIGSCIYMKCCFVKHNSPNGRVYPQRGIGMQNNIYDSTAHPLPLPPHLPRIIQNTVYDRHTPIYNNKPQTINLYESVKPEYNVLSRI